MHNVILTGNTYPARSIIKDMMGGQWDKNGQHWVVCEQKLLAALEKIRRPAWGMSDKKAIAGVIVQTDSGKVGIWDYQQ